MIITVGGIKGGSGKTTTAVNLAVMRAAEGKRVLLIDADEQHTAADFAEQREGLGRPVEFVTVRLAGAAVRAEARKLASGFHDIVIDTGGRDTTSQRAALTVSDILLVPFLPRSFDIWTLSQVNTLVAEMRVANERLRVFAFINRADTGAGRADVRDAAQMLAEAPEMEYLDSPLGQRKAFSNAAAEGLSVLEYRPRDTRACAEITDLYRHVFGGTETAV